tara:strand:- start:331 stop:525 length:195 start_codon:yes stop_codon:yes gene_type:complete
MKLSIDETEHVILALKEWATINLYDKKMYRDIKRLEARFLKSCEKKKGWEKAFQEYQLEEGERL